MKKKVGKKRLEKLGIKTPKKKPAKKKPVGRPPKKKRENYVTGIDEQGLNSYQRQRLHQSHYQKELRDSARDLTTKIPFEGIDWERRLACKYDLERFGQEYLWEAVPLPLSEAHKRCIAKAEEVSVGSGKFALAMPRGEGKTTWCIITIIKTFCYGFKNFIIFVGARDDKAKNTLDAVKSIFYNNPRLKQDFPELCYPVEEINGHSRGAHGQLFNRKHTHIEWKTDRLRFPSLVFDDEQAHKWYLQHDPESLVKIDDGWMNVQGGSLGYTYGITGALRGDVRSHPVTNALMRPDFVLLDDVQRDIDATSPVIIEKYIRIIDGAIEGMSGPTSNLSCLMPCTVIQEGDVAETYLTPEIKYAWRGERCSMVIEWPEGIDDYTISPDTRAGSLWLHYHELRKESLRKYKDNRLGNDFYKEHRTEMDEGFKVSWEHRKSPEDISAQQHAMNIRLDVPETFPAEYQNRPKPKEEDLAMPVKAEDLRRRLSGIQKLLLPHYVTSLCSYIDIQSEMLYYVTVACGLDFTGTVVDYGTWPEVPYRYFTRKTANNWMLLSKAFWSDPKNQNVKPEGKAAGGLIAPLEARIDYGLTKLVNILWNRIYFRQGQEDGGITHNKLGIDGRWGSITETVRQFCIRQRRPMDIVSCFGQGIRPDNNQYEEFDRRAGWIFEDMIHRGKKECNWVWRLDKHGQYYLSIDANRAKDFLMNRLACPMGTPGAITLFQDTEAAHEMFADQICKSESPEPLTGRGRTKNMWTEREGGSDNEYLDCFSGALMLHSWCGCRVRADGVIDDNNLQSRGRKKKIQKRKLSEKWAEKMGVA